MDIVDLVGRILFALVFWQNGYRQLAQRKNMIAYAAVVRRAVRRPSASPSRAS